MDDTPCALAAYTLDIVNTAQALPLDQFSALFEEMQPLGQILLRLAPAGCQPVHMEPL